MWQNYLWKWINLVECPALAMRSSWGLVCAGWRMDGWVGILHGGACIMLRLAGRFFLSFQYITHPLSLCAAVGYQFNWKRAPSSPPPSGLLSKSLSAPRGIKMHTALLTVLDYEQWNERDFWNKCIFYVPLLYSLIILERIWSSPDFALIQSRRDQRSNIYSLVELMINKYTLWNYIDIIHF